MNFNVRRGVMGANAPLPVVTRHDWNVDSILVLHSDGLRTNWRWEDLKLAQVSATVAAQRLLHVLARNDDDATVVVVKGRHGR
jgi:serine/threonine protein phosphatase PrpC